MTLTLTLVLSLLMLPTCGFAWHGVRSLSVQTSQLNRLLVPRWVGGNSMFDPSEYKFAALSGIDQKSLLFARVVSPSADDADSPVAQTLRLRQLFRQQVQ